MDTVLSKIAAVAVDPLRIGLTVMTATRKAIVGRGAEMSDPFRAVGITFVSGVPDSALASFIDGLESEIGRSYLPATREDIAIGLASGAFLAGEDAAVFMESAGIGTALDAITSLAIVYRFPLVLVVAWAGYEGRDVPHHNAIGERLDEVLGPLGLPTVRMEEGELASEVFLTKLSQARDLARAAHSPSLLFVIPDELGDPSKAGR